MVGVRLIKYKYGINNSDFVINNSKKIKPLTKVSHDYRLRILSKFRHNFAILNY